MGIFVEFNLVNQLNQQKSVLSTAKHIQEQTYALDNYIKQVVKIKSIYSSFGSKNDFCVPSFIRQTIVFTT